MKKDHNTTHSTTEYSPYVPSYREGKWEKLTLIRSTIIICITILTIGALMTISNVAHDKYMIVKSVHGMYIFDKSSGVTNYCDGLGCVAVSTGFIKPGSGSFSYQAPRNNPYVGYPQGQGYYPPAPYYGPMNPMMGNGYAPMMPMPWGPMTPVPYPYIPTAPTPIEPKEPEIIKETKEASPPTQNIYRTVPDEDMGAVIAVPEEQKAEAISTPEEQQTASAETTTEGKSPSTEAAAEE